MTHRKKYYELVFGIDDPVGKELLTYYLSEAGYDGFADEGDIRKAYIPEERFSAEALDELLARIPQVRLLEKRLITERNWNARWEENYPPVRIDNRIYIRARFHPPAPDGMLEIRITPKMSFGTGHHETTELMLRLLMDEDLSGKSLIDMGSGTGILAIAAEKTCASRIYAIDNDPWAYENMIENFKENGTRKIQAFRGGAEILSRLPATDIFMVNINLHILLPDIPHYQSRVKEGGKIWLSGFYVSDLPQVESFFPANAWKKGRQLTKNDWVGIEFVRLVKKI